MFHASLVPVAHTTPLRSGHVSYVLRRFELEPYLRTIQTYHITELSLVPPLVIALLMSPATKKYSLKSVRLISCGAAPLKPALQNKLKSEYCSPECVFNQVWGMTETSCIATMFSATESDDTGSVGRPIPNLDIKLIDEEGRDVSAFNASGEICVRGPTVIPGYFENESADRETFDGEGWLRTGDIGYVERGTGKWYVVDRKKELIKVRGFQVAPPELEGVLLLHPLIVDAAVIGVKGLAGLEHDVECPRAYVVRRPGPEGERLRENEVKEWCGTRLARYKALTGGAVFVDAIPKNASGKILKRVLRERAKAELEGMRDRAKI
jgi:acyl-CoA synthetase (AMP-forming)/AMP-acid ligase II